MTLTFECATLEPEVLVGSRRIPAPNDLGISARET
jgi:hypothetical protein